MISGTMILLMRTFLNAFPVPSVDILSFLFEFWKCVRFSVTFADFVFVTSDHSSKFVSHFFRSLRKALDMKLHFNLGYHLEGDGQTKHVNQTLEQYLCIFTNYQQDNWSSLLPLAEFSYNNTPNATCKYYGFSDKGS